MKKIKTTIFLVTMLLFSIVLPKQSYGQFPSHVYKGTNYDLGLIRNYDANTSIVSLMKNGQYYLAKINHNNYYLSTILFFTNATALDTFFTQMVDMCVCGNYVFVCGRGKYGDGLIGYMKISDIGLPAAPFVYFNIGCVEKIHSMVAYLDGSSQIKVVAVGRPNSSYDHFVVQIDDAVGMPSFTCKYVSDEVLHEVRQSGSHLVLIGYDLTNKAMSLRKANPNIGINDPMIDTKYYYYTTDDDILSRTVSKFSSRNPSHLAVSYMSQDNIGSIVTCIRYYDMQTMNMVDRQYFDPNSKVAPQEMTYVESVDRFVLLEPFNFAGTQNANFIFLQSGGIPYNARLLFYPSIEFWSLDCFNIQYFISCAPHNIYFQDCAVPVPYNPTCIQENDISVKIMPTVSFTPVYSPLLAASCLGSMDTVLQNWISLQFDYDCHNN